MGKTGFPWLPPGSVEQKRLPVSYRRFCSIPGADGYMGFLFPYVRMRSVLCKQVFHGYLLPAGGNAYDFGNFRIYLQAN